MFKHESVEVCADRSVETCQTPKNARVRDIHLTIFFFRRIVNAKGHVDLIRPDHFRFDSIFLFAEVLYTGSSLCHSEVSLRTLSN